MIFLTGPHGSGKTRISKLLAKHNFLTIDLGPTIRKIHMLDSPNKSFGEWVTSGESIYGQYFTDDLLVKKIKQEFTATSKKYSDLLILGSRSHKGLKYISDSFENESPHKTSVIYVEAPFEILYERYKNREGKQIGIDEFQEILAHDERMGLESIRQNADLIITNDSHLDKVRTEISKFLLELGYQELYYESKVKLK